MKAIEYLVLACDQNTGEVEEMDRTWNKRLAEELCVEYAKQDEKDRADGKLDTFYEYNIYELTEEEEEEEELAEAGMAPQSMVEKLRDLGLRDTDFL